MKTITPKTSQRIESNYTSCNCGARLNINILNAAHKPYCINCGNSFNNTSLCQQIFNAKNEDITL